MMRLAVSQHEASSLGQSLGFHSVGGEGRGDLTLIIIMHKSLKTASIKFINHPKQSKGSPKSNNYDIVTRNLAC